MDPTRPDESVVVAPAPAPGAARRLVTARQYLWVAGAVAVVSLALHFLGPAITPFLIGAIFAYLGTPLVDAMSRRRVPRTLGTVLTVLLFGIGSMAGMIALAGALTLPLARVAARSERLYRALSLAAGVFAIVLGLATLAART